MKERFYLKTKQEIKNIINNKINYIISTSSSIENILGYI